jgi:hypothetical protein
MRLVLYFTFISGINDVGIHEEAAHGPVVRDVLVHELVVRKDFQDVQLDKAADVQDQHEALRASLPCRAAVEHLECHRDSYPHL